MLRTILLCAGAYCIGSIPSGFLLVKLTRGVDVRQHGSHNVGAINVFRVGGKKLGIVTLIADVGKAVIVVVAASLVSSSPWVIAAAAMLALIGHAYSVWFYISEHRFSEGKSVASSLGALAGLAIIGAVGWWVPLAPLGIWIAGLLLPKLFTGRWWLFSPVTMTTAALVPVIVSLSHPHPAYIWMSAGLAILILIRHKNNIIRLLNGTEPHIGERVAVAQGSISPDKT
jgi:glycerol-3-phosphate acyltransferase PlsY